MAEADNGIVPAGAVEKVPPPTGIFSDKISQICSHFHEVSLLAVIVAKNVFAASIDGRVYAN